VVRHPVHVPGAEACYQSPRDAHLSTCVDLDDAERLELASTARRFEAAGSLAVAEAR
jgi:hypothetical protein